MGQSDPESDQSLPASYDIGRVTTAAAFSARHRAAGAGERVQRLALALEYRSAPVLIVIFRQPAEITPDRYRARLG